jgi:ABC-type spermidine/putrescine transport system permease subunit II
MQQLRGYVDPSVAAMSTLLVVVSLVLLVFLLPWLSRGNRANS